MKRSASFIAVMLLACSAISALAQTAGRFTVAVPASSNAGPNDAGVRAHTNLLTLATPANFSGKAQTYGPPFPGYFYEDPTSIACIYGLQPAGPPDAPACNPNALTRNPVGGSRAIAIVDAYDDPNAASDLAAFSAQFGLAAINSTSFQVVYAAAGGSTPGSCTGTATRPPVDQTGGWEIEESLDVQWAHAMAPNATLYLVEAQSNSDADLFCAVSVASALVSAAGGGEVSMSWGGGEYSGEMANDVVFTNSQTPNVVYFASAGDSPGAIYPSASPYVVSVGGTTLSRNPVTGAFLNENTWQDAGSGPSFYEPRPPYQDSIRLVVGSSRGTPDVAMDANPTTGVWVLDNFDPPPGGCGGPCWYVVGGTSVSSPTFAGIVNAAGSFAASTTAELTNLYKDFRLLDFNNVNQGTCGDYAGYSASNSWNFCSGLGSPRGYTGK